MKQCVSDWNPADYEGFEDDPKYAWWFQMTEEEKTAYEDEQAVIGQVWREEMDRLEDELCERLGVGCLSEVCVDKADDFLIVRGLDMPAKGSRARSRRDA